MHLANYYKNILKSFEKREKTNFYVGVTVWGYSVDLKWFLRFGVTVWILNELLFLDTFPLVFYESGENRFRGDYNDSREKHAQRYLKINKLT